jgi:hypothetical protein
VRFRDCVALLVIALGTTPALATPGLGEQVYGATVEPGVTEFETRYGRLVGGPADSTDAAVVEISHGFGRHFYGAVVGEMSREPGGRRSFDAVAVEGIVPLGRVEALQLDVAIYGEYGFGRHGNPDGAETKLLLQHRRGPFDARLNLVLEKELRHGEPAEYGYAASVDWAVLGDLRLGLEAFGDVGDTHRFGGRREHFAGPIVKTDIEGLPGGSELEVEAGYLRAFGASRDATSGQLRFVLAWETHFGKKR